jgi:hypothetical protein
MEQVPQSLSSQIEHESSLYKNYTGLRSAIFQPERVSINSQDDISEIIANEDQVGFYNQFRIILRNPILNCKSLDLLKATFPLITTNIPNTELTFWYHKRLITGNSLQPLSLDTLKCIRINPSYYSRDLVSSIYPINRYYYSYTDLLYDLNLACQNDSNNPYFIANDIQFSYDISQNKFSFTGSDSNYAYQYAGFDDMYIAIANPLLFLSTANNFGINGISGQPYKSGRTLNLRLGFICSGNYPTVNSQLLHIRPYFDSNYNILNNTLTYTGESYCDLVYSQNANIYCNLTGGSAYSSENGGIPNFLMAMPLNTSPLGVAYFNNTQIYPLTKIPREIYEIGITLKTDTGDPFYVPESENIALEIGFNYFV